jgi:protein gp37
MSEDQPWLRPLLCRDASQTNQSNGARGSIGRRDPGRKRHYIDAIDDQGRWSGKLIPVPESLGDPFKWPSTKTVFVNPMSDLFHESVPTEFISAVAQTMIQTPWHTYQLLTKRSDRLRHLLATELAAAASQAHIRKELT